MKMKKFNTHNMRTFAQYLESRDQKLHYQIIDEGIVGDAAKWVGDKVKGAYQEPRTFLESSCLGLRINSETLKLI